MITITDDASKYIKDYLLKVSNENKFNHVCHFDIKVIVKKMGCNGQKYSLNYITVGEICEGELASLASNGIHVWFLPEQKHLIENCMIDLEGDSMNHRIKITNESLPIIECGCGESFYINDE